MSRGRSWPHRVIGGHCRQSGIEHELGISEPAKAHVLRGLLLWTEFSVLEHGNGRGVLRGTALIPMAGECPANSWNLQLPAAEVFDVEESRAPLERRPVDDLGVDVRQSS